MWQPIETAPKDRWILGIISPNDHQYVWDYGATDDGLTPPLIMAVIWHEDEYNSSWRAFSKDGGAYGLVDVTQWQPLPEPPVE